ncbi:sigma-70 family RNA polymerase sigma factor [Lactobacillus sp. S2-2]|uniref:sigma-70 family RNA polymerase sigma factor n=1 Tax=Lactobacillus sp. S2-2 TaxID=2692917 RepID=UPI001F298D2E|nr:sigma-70 family RNA polymerase sigma factor [Lactobacillus sp. S2-2]MCF6515227.1 sigma-70 family RNA polymerase sigma factor [Lactobacillus sp. S2-2]
MENQTNEAFEFLMRDKHEVLIYGVLKRLNVQPYSRHYDDLVQEGRLAFVEIYLKYPDDRTNYEAMMSYIYQGVYWKILDNLKRLTSQKQKEDANDPADTLITLIQDQSIEDNVALKIIMEKVIHLLNDEERELFEFRYLDNLNVTQIAKRWNRSRGYIYRRQAKLTEKLKQYFV